MKPNSPTSQNIERALEVLKSIRHLESLPENVLLELATTARLRSFRTGEVIYLEGEKAETIYILESGWVKATKMSPEGREQSMLLLRPGEFFGDIAVFTDTNYPGTVTALEPVIAWSIEKSTILRLISNHPEFAMAVIRRLSERVMFFIGLAEDLSLRSVEARLANTLLKHAHEKDGRLIVPRRPWATFDMMATRLGTVRDVLRRALRTMENEGLLQVEKHYILIKDPKGLKRRGNP
jgi:CRP-like cAMP-binding protein